jgi:hypothetical protein
VSSNKKSKLLGKRERTEDEANGQQKGSARVKILRKALTPRTED